MKPQVTGEKQAWVFEKNGWQWRTLVPIPRTGFKGWWEVVETGQFVHDWLTTTSHPESSGRDKPAT
jgi:hypothetical protein